MADVSSFPSFANVTFLDGKVPHHSREFSAHLSPCFQLMLYLEGRQTFYIDDHLFDIDAGQGRDAHPQILLFNRTKASRLRSVASHGDFMMRKVKISVPVTWVQDLGCASGSELIGDFCKGHLNASLWAASERMVALGEDILNPPPAYDDRLMPEAARLYRSAKGLELLAQACADMVSNQSELLSEAPAIASGHSHKVRAYILDNLQHDLTIERISREVGASKRSIQRNFRDRFGMTVSEFIRKQRLEKARTALERDGVSVGQAAYLAGYGTISSFSNAFKQLYGVSPKSWRQRALGATHFR